MNIIKIYKERKLKKQQRAQRKEFATKALEAYLQPGGSVDQPKNREQLKLEYAAIFMKKSKLSKLQRIGALRAYNYLKIEEGA